MAALFQRCLAWLFSTHPVLRVRTSMSLFGVLLMLAASGVMLWLASAGYLPLAHAAVWAVVATGGLVLMTLVVRLRISSNRRDPALTLPQILWALSCSAAAYVLAAEAKGVVPGLMAITLLFAALNLRARQILGTSLYALAVLGLAVWGSSRTPQQAEPALEIAYAAVLCIMLCGSMTLSLRLHQLRVRLRQQRQELARALEENRELASRDPLTGLLNRRHMLELLHLEQRRCLRGGRRMLLAQMDIDHFKRINDTHGHGMGDRALQVFADVVKRHIRSSDVVARWGGEEFVLLLSDTDTDGALLTLDRVRAAVQGCRVVDRGETLQMTVSIGLAAHIAGESLEVTLDRADKALYCAKRAGRNQVVFSDRPGGSMQMSRLV